MKKYAFLLFAGILTVTIVASSNAQVNSGKIINVNIFGGSNPFNNSGWNNWNLPANRISPALKFADGVSSAITITSSISLGVTDNGIPYPTTMCPPEVGRYALLSSTAPHTLIFSNLKTNGTKYDLEIYASRKNTGNSTRFTVGSTAIDINTASNYTNAAKFTAVQPNASGQIVITVTRAAGTYAYVNGLKLTEIDLNQTPVSNAGADQIITLPANTVLLNGSGADGDGTIVSYQWRKISGPSQFTITSAANAQTDVNNLIQGVYKFELQVTDNLAASAKDTISVTVNPDPSINQLPIAVAGADQTIVLPVNSITLNGTGSDADGTIASYLWTKISGPSQFTITSAANAQTSVTDLVQGVYDFELTAIDDDGDTGRDIVRITVNATPPNQPPSVNAGTNQTIILPVNSVNLSGTSIDADGTVTAVQWNKVSGPTQFSITSPNSLQTSITGLAQGVYDFELIATDNGGAAGKDTVRITVNPTPPNDPTIVANMTVDSFPRSAQYETYGLTKLPPGYNFSVNKRYPLLLWLHSAEEGAAVTSPISTKGNKSQLIKMANVKSPVQWIANGWNLTAVNPKTGLRDTFIVIAPQHYNDWSYSYNELRFILPNIISRYRVDTTRLYMMGISAGGGGINTCMGSKDSVFIKRIAAAVTMISAGLNSASGPGGSFTSLQVEGNLGTAAAYGTRVWTIAGEDDSFLNYDLSLHNSLNKLFPTPRMKFTVWSGFDHTSNGPWLDTNRRSISNYYNNVGTCNNGCVNGGVPVQANNIGATVRGSGVTQDSLNVLEWLLMFQRNVQIKTVPTAVAGNDQTITLPANSVILNGTGSNPGAGASFITTKWEKVMGPAAGIITSPNALTTTITGLAAGNYVFKLSVTNSFSISHTAMIRITVNNNQTHWFPTVTLISADTQNITSSTATVSANVTTTATGIKSIKWMKIKTPGQTPKKFVWLGSSTLAGSGASVGDSAVYNRIVEFGNANGLFSSNVNLAQTGSSIFQCMPSSYTPQGIEDAPLIEQNVTFALANHANAHAIVIGYPSNDYDVLTIDRILFAYQTVYDSIVAAGKKCFIYTTQPRESFGTIARLRLREISDSLVTREQNGRFATGTIISIHAPLTDLSGELMLYNSGDDIHQNNTGHRVMANNTIGSSSFFPNWASSSSVITSPSSLNTTITGLINGTHQFMVAVTDDYDHTAYATTTITVNTISNQPPIVNAGTNQTITIPVNTVTVNGSATDADGTIASYLWTKISGPAQNSIITPTTAQTGITNLVQGVYQFELLVTDNLGAIGKDTVSITVNTVTYGIPLIDASANQTIVSPASSASVTSSYTLRGATLKNLKWTKASVPNQSLKKVVWIGSSTLLGAGATTEDSAIVWRVGNHYTRMGIMSSWSNLGVSGANVFEGMPNGYIKTGAQPSPDLTHNVTYALNQDPDIVIVGYPSNGYDGSLSITEILFAYRTIYNTVINAGKKCYIMTSQPRPAFGTTGRNLLKQIADSIMLQYPDTYIQAYYNLVETGTHNLLYNSGDNIHVNNTGHRVLFNSVIAKNIFEPWATSSSSILSPVETNTGITNLSIGKHRFQVTVTDTHEQSITDTTTITVNPEPGITSNAGVDRNITLPVSSISLDGSASSGATSYLWVQLTGPAVTTIVSPVDVTTLVNGLSVAGTYSFELAINGGASRDIVFVFVTQGGGNKTININIFGGANPYNNIQWNNWNEPANRTSPVLKYADGINSGVTITTSIVLGVTDNGSPYPTTMCPPEVGRYAMLSSTTAHTLTFNNLKTDGTLYNLDIFASRKNTGNTTRFTVNGRVVDITTASNYANTAQFTSVQPNASGQIVITITRAAGAYAYVNGLRLTELGIVYVKK